MEIKSKINRIRQSKDGKVLVENFAYLSLLQVAGYVFPLLTLPYLARVIGVDGFGKIAFASGVMVWIQTIADWGFNFTATRDVAKNRDNKDKVSEIFFNVLWARCVLMFFSFAVLLVLVLVVPEFKENATVIFVTFLMIPLHILFPDWFFQAMERMKYITMLNLLSKLLFTAAVFIFITDKDDYILQPLFVSLGFVISGIIAMYYILVRWRVRLCRPSLVSIKMTIKNSTDVFVNNLMPNLYNSFSVVLLGMWGGSVSNGKLDAGNRFVNIVQQFMTIISRVFYPFLSRRIDKHDLYVKFNVLVALCLSVMLFFGAPLLVRIFFTDEFYDSILVLRILSISVVFLSLSNIYGTNYMIIEGHERKLRNVTASSSLIGFVLSFPLIYYFDFVGAAITIALTRGILGTSVMIKALLIKRDKKLLTLK